jgi:hypothetical protein
MAINDSAPVGDKTLAGDQEIKRSLVIPERNS